ncbi:MAG: ribosome silencing factor [Synergistaceae bacterium]|jgi:ribosome-associated protein|nr:ribosome silencing factor [Synergistaceae bacterium]
MTTEATAEKETTVDAGEYMPVIEALRQKHAIDIDFIDLKAVSGFADAFIIATARSEINASALLDAATDALEKMGFEYKVEGEASSRWKLVDAGNTIIHIFSKAGREFYKLERLWGDAHTIRFESEE